jgi:predicted dehydrogenase
MRLAFIGGNGHHYLKNLIGDSKLDLEIAVASDGYDTDAAQALAKRIGATQWFDSPSTLFDEFTPDVVNIGAVYGHNGEIAAKALERDIAVVSDKPIAATWEQLQRLRELTENNSRILLTEFPFRSQPEFRAARQSVINGDIGEVVLATAQKSYRFGASRPEWYGRREDYSGTLLWVASHGIDAIRFCTGVPFSKVIGVDGNIAKPDYPEMEDHIAALFRLQNGGNAVVHADFLRPSGALTHGDDRLRVAGTKGVVEVQNDRCLLINLEGESDITDSVKPQVRPIERELLAIINGESSELYSTLESISLAEILLLTRDATDSSTWTTLV